MSKYTIIVVLCLLFLSGFLLSKQSLLFGGANNRELDKKPLYWIDPMEPQIYYSAPGKSRMNMELVPVYEEERQNPSNATPSITIAPEIVNKLGVRTAEVKENPISPVIRLFGSVKGNEDKIAHIHVYVEGWIKKLYVRESQAYVEKDQPLLEIYSRAFDVAKSEYLIQSKERWKGFEDVTIGKLRSLGVSEKQISELISTQKSSANIVIYSPQAGYIDSLNIREGMWVKPETTIMSITDLSEVWVYAELFPANLAYVKSGQVVHIFLPQSPTITTSGVVDYIYPEVDPVALTSRVRIRLPNPDLYFKLNMAVGVEIQGMSKLALTIPKESVIWGKNEQHVIVALAGERFQSRKVTTGIEDSNKIEIIDGLVAGEKVVASAQFLLDSEINLKAALQRLDSTSIMDGNIENKGANP